MFDDFGTSVDIRHFALQLKTLIYDHGILESFEVRKQIIDMSTLD